MRRSDVAALLVLAAVWGTSFLFLRIAAPAFGPAALIFIRVGVASLIMLPLLALQGQFGELRRHWRPIFIVGLTSSALPYLLGAIGALALSAGLMSIFNATTPLWTAVIAWLWLGMRLSPLRVAGLAIGFAGVLFLVVDEASLATGANGVSVATALAATLAAPVFYGWSANYARRAMTGMAPLAMAAGSQAAAALVLAVPAALTLPSEMPGPGPWLAALLLATLCTAFAIIVWFRLIHSAGAANASTVTFLVPVSAVTLGTLVLDEALSPAMIGSCAVILFGTALATGLIGRRTTIAA